jgi:hypothetical protein
MSAAKSMKKLWDTCAQELLLGAGFTLLGTAGLFVASVLPDHPVPFALVSCFSIVAGAYQFSNTGNKLLQSPEPG